jgi:hypothetical protein
VILGSPESLIAMLNSSSSGRENLPAPGDKIGAQRLCVRLPKSMSETLTSGFDSSGYGEGKRPKFHMIPPPHGPGPEHFRVPQNQVPIPSRPKTYVRTHPGAYTSHVTLIIPNSFVIYSLSTRTPDVIPTSSSIVHVLERARVTMTVVLTLRKKKRS